LVHRPLRRVFAGASTAAIVAIVAVSVGVADDARPFTVTSTELPPPPPPSTTASPTVDSTEPPAPRPLRVLVVGDSVMLQVGAALNGYASQHPDELVVFNHARLGCPIARGGSL